MLVRCGPRARRGVTFSHAAAAFLAVLRQQAKIQAKKTLTRLQRASSVGAPRFDSTPPGLTQLQDLPLACPGELRCRLLPGRNHYFRRCRRLARWSFTLRCYRQGTSAYCRCHRLARWSFALVATKRRCKDFFEMCTTLPRAARRHAPVAEAEA